MKIKVISFLIFSIVFATTALSYSPQTAFAGTCTDALQKALLNEFKITVAPTSIGPTGSATITANAELKSKYSDCETAAKNTTASVVYKFNGKEFEQKNIAIKIGGANISCMCKKASFTDTISWQKISAGAELPDTPVAVTIIGKTYGQIQQEINFGQKLTISKTATTPTPTPTIPKTPNPIAIITGDACKDLDAVINSSSDGASKSPGGDVTKLPKFCDTGTVYNKVANFLYYIVGIAAVISLIYGGYMYMTAGSNDSRKTKGKDIIVYSIAGIVLVLLAVVIVNVIVSLVVDNTFF